MKQKEDEKKKKQALQEKEMRKMRDVVEREENKA